MKRLKRLGSLASAAVLSCSALLNIAFVPMAHAATRTWTGLECLDTQDMNMTTATNWSGNVAPVAGDTLVFPDNPTCRTPNNDFAAGTEFAAINFTHPVAGTFGSYDISGNQLAIADGGSITTEALTPGAELIDLPVKLNGNVTVDVNGSELQFLRVVSGTGNIVKSGNGGLLMNGANTYTGNFTASAGRVSASNSSSFGVSTNTVTVNDGADLSIGVCVDGYTFPYAMTLNGASTVPSGASVLPKLTVGGSCTSGGVYDEYYGGYPTTDDEFVLSGAVTLGSNVTFGGFAKKTTLTGVLSGAHEISLVPKYAGQFVISSSNNTSETENGTLEMALITQTLSDDQSSSSVSIGNKSVITIDGKRSSVHVASGGKLMGGGTVGALVVATGGSVAPGHSPGCINSGNLNLAGTYEFEVGGTAACTGYDQLKVTGTVNLTNGSLQATLYNGFVPTVGQSYTIVDNDGADVVTGTFTGIAEGADYTNQGVTYTVTYVGGDGNDVVLTVKAVNASELPNAPNTGFKLLTTNPLVTLIATSLAAAGILVVRNKLQSSSKK